MYSHVLGRALNYGQPLGTSAPESPSMYPQPADQPTSFLDRQINVYGMPGGRKRRGPGTAAPQPTGGVVMPNGVPTPAVQQSSGGAPPPGSPQQSDNDFMAPQPQAQFAPAPQQYQPPPQQAPQQQQQQQFAPQPQQQAPSSPSAQQPLQQPSQQPQQWAPSQAAPFPAWGSVNAEGAYQPGVWNGPQYQAQKIGAFNAPQFGSLQSQQQQLLEQMLANPGTLNPQVLAQMKGQSTDQAALLQQQSMGQLRDSLAGRGINANAGFGLGQQRQIMADTNSNILNNLRGLDIQAAQTNRGDTLNALQAAGAFQNQGFNQALQGYQANLQGSEANRAEQLAALNSGIQNFGINQQMQQQGSNSLLQAIQNRNQSQSIANQNNQFGQNLGFQREQFDWQKSQQQQQMEAQRAAQGQAQSNWEAQQAWQAQQAQDQQWQSLMDYLMGGGGQQEMWY